MPIWHVYGGRTLSGCVRVQGSKNAVLPIMAASLLCRGETLLHHCPDLLDVEAAVEILQHLGCVVQRSGSDIHIDARCVSATYIPHELMLKMRSSVMFMGAILARTGQARLSRPGGCELGSRPIDLHIKGLRELGADISEIGGDVDCRAEGLTGTQIHLDFPSVGATENIMIAACTARGTSIITNAAREPEIVDLQGYLRCLGAKISGAGTSMITVEGACLKEQAEYTVMSDRIVAGTYLCAAAAAGGDITLEDVVPEHLMTISNVLREMGCGIICSSQRIRLRSCAPLKAAKPIITKPYPGFPTDGQALLMAVALKAKGTTVFVENIFENRYRHAAEMRRLGADIRTEGRVAMVSGGGRLMGAPVTATDLRGGAALVLAGLAAEGETTVYDAGHIGRGYENFEASLSELGAQLRVEYR